MNPRQRAARRQRNRAHRTALWRDYLAECDRLFAGQIECHGTPIEPDPECPLCIVTAKLDRVKGDWDDEVAYMGRHNASRDELP